MGHRHLQRTLPWICSSLRFCSLLVCDRVALRWSDLSSDAGDEQLTVFGEIISELKMITSDMSVMALMMVVVVVVLTAAEAATFVVNNVRLMLIFSLI